MAWLTGVGAMAETAFAEELVDSVRLSLVSGVGPLLRKALIERFGTPAAVLAALTPMRADPTPAGR